MTLIFPQYDKKECQKRKGCRLPSSLPQKYDLKNLKILQSADKITRNEPHDPQILVRMDHILESENSDSKSE